MPRGASSGKPSARSGESRGEEEHTLTAVAARLEREAESFAAASTASVNAVNADDEHVSLHRCPPAFTAVVGIATSSPSRGGARGTGTGDWSVAFPAIPGWR